MLQIVTGNFLEILKGMKIYCTFKYSIYFPSNKESLILHPLSLIFSETLKYPSNSEVDPSLIFMIVFSTIAMMIIILLLRDEFG